MEASASASAAGSRRCGAGAGWMVGSPQLGFEIWSSFVRRFRDGGSGCRGGSPAGFVDMPVVVMITTKAQAYDGDAAADEDNGRDDVQ